ncbi:hypothetical protein BN938_0840 [Mucinivorans hirudinis]|uniref:6-bladed beta-propeller n=1 Tax=Mucinivorans hirudinis TaxID=1433126 RepID=A0A060R6Y7_9BACT|nr:hypothetical protein BN938_0840 [Mucinivorans hirudinis]
MIVALALSCGDGGRVDVPQAAVIGSREGDLVTVNIREVSDTVDMPLSAWVEDLEIVQLDGSSDDAFTNGYKICLSDNYILIFGNITNATKLYERKTGKFVGNIGNVGRGPGEYFAIYSAQIDEPNGLIYSQPWQMREILVHNLRGEFTGRIPLANVAEKGNIRVDVPNRVITVSVIPFKGGSNSAVWVQDFEGNVIDSVAAGRFAVNPDYSNEVDYNGNTDAFDFSLLRWSNQPDTLYHYENKVLKPVFTVTIDGLEPSKGYADAVTRTYNELPGYFLGGVGQNRKVEKRGNSESTTVIPVWMYVDKKELRGAWFRLRNDFVGGRVEYPTFTGGYFVSNVSDPFKFVEQLEAARGKASAAVRERIDGLLKSIDPEGNNVLMLGRVKQ